jgi:hypothetical protein
VQLLAVPLKNRKIINLCHIKKVHLLSYSEMRDFSKLNFPQFNEISDNCDQIKVLLKHLPFTLRGITRSCKL